MATILATLLKHIGVYYTPVPDSESFVSRAQTQAQNGIDVTVSVLDAHESKRFFGVPLARRGIQPVWLRIVNSGQVPCRLHVVSVDPNYYSPHEAAAANHFSTGKRLLGFGALAWLFFPLLCLIPLKIIGGWRANRKIDEYFLRHAFRLRPIPPGGVSEGFVFTPIDAGSKVVHVRLFHGEGTTEFVFNITVPGLSFDYQHRDFEDLSTKDQLIDCDIPTLRQRVIELPATTTNARGTKQGDPVNLIVAGEFATILSGFGARWDETETITLATCWKTFRAFLLGSEYRYSPVSPLYLFGRSHDFALQRVRASINERLHLRLWATPMRFEGVPVWVGQISRDIGVRFTHKTWNLTTHRIDPDVDEARDYVVEDLLEAGRLEVAGYGDGVGACAPSDPRHNLTGDPWFSDGKRAAVKVSTTRTTPRFVNWA